MEKEICIAEVQRQTLGINDLDYAFHCQIETTKILPVTCLLFCRHKNMG